MTAPRSLRRGSILLVFACSVQHVHEHEAGRQEREEDRGAEVLEDDDRLRDPKRLCSDDVGRLRPPDIRLSPVVALDEDRLVKPSARAVCGTYGRLFTRKGDNGSANAELIA